MNGMYRVDEATCTSCGECVEACPTGAITLADGRAHIDDAACIDCGSCARACPQGAIVLVDAVAPTSPVIRPEASLTPAAPGMMASAEAASLAHRAGAELLSAEPRRGRFWPMVGGALVWAARELLPEVLTAWRTSRTGIVQPADRRSVTFGRVASQKPRAGRRHRWGRA